MAPCRFQAPRWLPRRLNTPQSLPTHPPATLVRVTACSWCSFFLVAVSTFLIPSGKDHVHTKDVTQLTFSLSLLCSVFLI